MFVLHPVRSLAYFTAILCIETATARSARTAGPTFGTGRGARFSLNRSDALRFDGNLSSINQFQLVSALALVEGKHVAAFAV